MRVFVTGASGWIGSGVVPELVDAGHQVVGLARSDASAVALAEAGADVHRGSLEDLDGLREAAAAADGVIHLAFIHDFENYESSVRVDRHAVDTLGAALQDTGRPLVIASGVAAMASGPVATEEDPGLPGFPRTPAAEATLALAGRGVRPVVVRLPPSVHGRGDVHGFISILISIARARGASAYIGDGANRWPAVHQRDAAHLFRLALERAPAGSVLHAVADEGVPTRAVADAIGRHLGVPVVSVPAEDAAEHFGWMGGFFGFDIPASSARTRALLGWEPTQPGLLDDIDLGHYFQPDVPQGVAMNQH